MINILIHGLGQNETSWSKVKEILNQNKIEVETPNIFSIVKNEPLNYENLYKNFKKYCNKFNDKINLVGLSLGGILTIDYLSEYPEKVNSIIVSGMPYKIPKLIFNIQTIIYKLMPKKIFQGIGCNKKDFINLLISMKNIEIAEKAKNINCKTLVICGEKEKNNINMKSAKEFNKVIKNSNLKIIPYAGHEVNIDSPEELAKIIKNFLK